MICLEEKEVDLLDEGFEESVEQTTKKDQSFDNSKGGNRPDFRIVQVSNDKSGNTVYTSVGGMWKNISKNGNEFYTLKIGQLKLLVFPNNK